MGRKPKYDEYKFDKSYFCTKFFEYGKKFYLSPYIPQEEPLFNDVSEEKQLLDQLEMHDAEESPSIALLKYIAGTHISYSKFVHTIKKSNDIHTDLLKECSFYQCDILYPLIRRFCKNLLDELKNNKYISFPDYPFKKYNLFFESKSLNYVFDNLKDDTKEKSTIVSDNLKKVFDYINMENLFKDLFPSPDNNPSHHATPKCSIISLVFLIQTYFNRKEIPLHMQYVIMSDSLISLMVARKFKIENIWSSITQLKKFFLKKISASITVQTNFEPYKNSNDDDFDNCISNDLDILRNDFCLNYATLQENYIEFQTKVETFRLIEKYLYETKNWAKATETQALTEYNELIKRHNESSATINQPKLSELNQPGKNEVITNFRTYFHIEEEIKFMPLKKAIDNYILPTHLSHQYENIEKMHLIALPDDRKHINYPPYFENLFYRHTNKRKIVK